MSDVKCYTVLGAKQNVNSHIQAVCFYVIMYKYFLPTAACIQGTRNNHKLNICKGIYKQTICSI